MKIRLVFIMLFLGLFLSAQDSSEDEIYTRLYLDSLFVTADAGFTVDDFIDIVVKDESYYRAFQNLRRIHHELTIDFDVFTKRGQEKAAWDSKRVQTIENNQRKFKVKGDKTTGKIVNDRGEHVYITGKLIKRLFLKEGGVPKAGNNSKPPTSRMEGHIDNLKKLMFSPGQQVDVPIIGKKAAIFSKKMLPYYDFSLNLVGNSSSEYLFTARVKPNTRRKATVIKFLEVRYNAASKQILSKKYKLSYKMRPAMDFDVTIFADINHHNQVFYPNHITYQGNWHVAGRKRERVAFTIDFEQL